MTTDSDPRDPQPDPQADPVLVEEVDGGVVIVTLNDPDRLNPLSMRLVSRLHGVLDDLAADGRARAVVLTGAGRGFCSGADLAGPGEQGEPADDGEPEDDGNPVAVTLEQQERLASLHERIHRLRLPVIAAVNGPAVGGGFSLSLACDVRVAAVSARFGAVFIRMGISGADMGTSYLLPRLVGASRSAELLLTGRIFDAREAERIGLVLDVVDDGAVIDRALETARTIAAHSPLAVWMTKETMWQTIDAPSLRHAIDMENRTQTMCYGSGEMQRAAEAFMTGDEPQWRPL